MVEAYFSARQKPLQFAIKVTVGCFHP
jgi:hypothetical protein